MCKKITTKIKKKKKNSEIITFGNFTRPNSSGKISEKNKI